MTDRLQLITKYISTDGEGIEIGPFHSPLLPKAAGNRVLVMDVFDAAHLRVVAANDTLLRPNAAEGIEEVDLVGSCDQIVDLVSGIGKVGRLSYIVSSHNFEHLPNPIKFLHGCSHVLSADGVVSMAVPDFRCCFDYFRPMSTTADFLAAYLYKIDRPTNYQHFVINSLHSRFVRDGQMFGGFSIHDDPRKILPLQTLKEALAAWQHAETVSNPPYRDTHCSTFTPSSVELILTDLQFLGLLPFEILEITPPNGHEFYIHLKNNPGRVNDTPSPASFYERRERLLFQIKNEEAENSPAYYALRQDYNSIKEKYERQAAEIRRLLE